MFIFQKIKEISFKLASFGRLGQSTLGMFLSSLAAFPILFLGRILYDINSTIFYWFIGLVVVFSIVIISFALHFISDEYPSNIVLDKVIGMMLTFAFIPLRWKLMLFGFVFFHVVNFFRPFLFCKTLGKRINELPFGLGILAGDVVTGVICNIFLQIIVWVVR
ncbi:hypothetical protein GF322_03365 [Candidatus Dependentiae bacterium]|nr:hypothetical protein [Candidatus Dependentiae bacterium]